LHPITSVYREKHHRETSCIQREHQKDLISNIRNLIPNIENYLNIPHQIGQINLKKIPTVANNLPLLKTVANTLPLLAEPFIHTSRTIPHQKVTITIDQRSNAPIAVKTTTAKKNATKSRET
jgi:hypothetical protein